MEEHYKYVDIIRRPDGTLRPWEEHDKLAKGEQKLDLKVCEFGHNYIKEKHKLIENENEQRE